MKRNPESDPLSEAPLLRSIPKVDPIAAPDGFFDRFPQQVQRAIAQQKGDAWWNKLLPNAPLPRVAWAVGASVLAAVVWFNLPQAPEQAANRSLASEDWDAERALDDPYLLAELSIDGEHAPGVQHDLSADELAAYLYAHNATDFLTELQ